jgi:hypothetical protein
MRVLQMVEKLAQHIWSLVDGREQLWAAYGLTILSWSLPTPTFLNGPLAAVNLSLQWPIFGISACNPFDRELSEGLNDQRTRRLALAVAKRTTSYWIGEGRAFDDTYSEPTVFCENMDCSTALGLGTRYGQRAIFQIDEETVSVIACRTGEIIRAWRRHWDDLTGPMIVLKHPVNPESKLLGMGT